MAENSRIGWTTHTFNPWIGCVKVSEGCKFCYAEADMDKRRKRVTWGPLPRGTRILTSDSYWRKPFQWDREAEGATERPRVFCASLADVFEDWEGPITLGSTEWIGSQLYLEEDGAWSTGGGVLASRDRRSSLTPLRMDHVRERLFEMIGETPNLDWLLLTKRPENVMKMVPERWQKQFPKNVWIGTSCEDQKATDERIPHLLKCPAAVRFLSCEPLLGPLNLDCLLCYNCGGNGTVGFGDCTDRVTTCPECDGRETNIEWVIIGGESGPGARSMSLGWALDLIEQCKTAVVPVFVKQLGKRPLGNDPDGGFHDWPVSNSHGSDIDDFPMELRVREFPEVAR